MQFLKNLDRIVEARLDHGQSLSLAPKLVGLPLFGGIERETREELETGFSSTPFDRYTALQLGGR